MALAPIMPRHDIGVMLHDRQNNLVALANVQRLSQGRGNRIESASGRTSENDLVSRPGVEENAGAFPRRLVGVRRRIGEIMQAAMNVGIFMLVCMHHARDDLPRLLRRCPVVEIDERFSIRLLGQDRKIRPHLVDVVWRVGSVHHAVLFPSQARNRPANSSRKFSSSTCSIASAPKASSNNPSASLRGSPRAMA